MNNNFLSSSRSTSRLVVALLIVFIQIPAFGFAFDSRPSVFSRSNIFPILSRNTSPIDSLVVFSNTTSFTVADATAGGPGVASLYPSPITVSALAGTISDVNVTINGLTTARPRDIDVLLVSPGGLKFVLMADTGQLCAVSNANITFDDGAASLLPENLTGCPPGTPISTGTFRPTNYIFGVEVDTFPAPAPAAPYNLPAPTGAATLASTFNGTAPNGTWNLYVADDSLGGGASTIAGGWSIDITTVGGIDPTTTIINSNLNPALTTQNVTYTSTTTNNTTAAAVTTGTVSFTNNGAAIAGCSNVAVNGSGNAACTTISPEGTRTIAANYNGTATLGTSTASLSQVINSPTVVTGAQFCNNGGISMPDAPATTSVYPSNVTVSGLFGTVSTVTVLLNDLNTQRTDHLDFLLVGPANQALEIMSDAGENATTLTNFDLAIFDAAPTLMPLGTPLLAPGNYRPTDNGITGDAYPAPAPGTFNTPGPTGVATFGSVYGGIDPNGTWRLFALDDAVGGTTNTISGWCVQFAVTPFATTTTVTSSQNPSIVGQLVTFTATVTSGAGTPSGNVQFFDGATPIGGPVALNGSGQATVNTAGLTAATHAITANYAGASVGAAGGGFGASGGSLTGGQVVSNTATWDGSASGDWHNLANWSTNFVPVSGTNNIDVPAAGVTNNPVITSADVTAANMTIGGNRTITIGIGRTLNTTGVVGLGTGQVVGLGMLSLGTASTITHGVGGQVEATLRKNFGGPGPSFEFPVGTPGQFSPMNVLVTIGSGQLTARANTGVPGIVPVPLDVARTLQRYWTLSGSGIRSNITFNYLNGDVPGPPNDETAWAIIRVTGNVAIAYTSAETYVVMDPSNNRFTINDLESYSHWTAGVPLAPTAANANVSGRVVDGNGRGIYGAKMALQNQQGQIVWAITNPFGYYRFLDVPAGQNYILSVSNKRYQFQPRTLNLVDDLTDVDFVPVSGPDLREQPSGSSQPRKRDP